MTLHIGDKMKNEIIKEMIVNMQHMIMTATSTTSVFDNGSNVIKDNVVPLAVFVMIIGGLMWMVPLRQAKEFAKQHMLEIIIGLILISSSAAIVNAFYVK